MVVTYTNSINFTSIKIIVLLDISGTEYTFFDEKFTSNINVLHHPYQTLWVLEVIDVWPIEFKEISHITWLKININDHCEEITIFDAPLGYSEFS